MRNPTILLAALALGAAAISAPAQTQSKPANRAPAEAGQTPAERLKALQSELNEARNAWMKEYQKAPEAEREKFVEKNPYPDAKKQIPEAWKVVEADPKDPAAFSALQWIMSESRGGADFAKALDAIARDHMSNPHIGDICQNLQYETSEKAEHFLREVAKGPDHNNQGIATYSLAKQLVQRASTANYIKKGLEPKQREAFEKSIGAEEFAKLEKLDTKKTNEQAEALFATCAEKFADIKMNRSTIGELAKAELHEIRDLAIGKTAPEISGEDLEGAPIKLSEYRGKIVVLDFWGNW
jgi:hypothetical protein